MSDCNRCLWATRNGSCASWDCRFVDQREAYEAYNREKADANKWIPVSERLPEEDKEVMVSVHFLGLDQKHPSGWNDHIKENYYVDVGSQIDGEWSSYSDEYKVARNRHIVVAWMPLPEPWKGDNNAD